MSAPASPTGLGARNSRLGGGWRCTRGNRCARACRLPSIGPGEVAGDAAGTRNVRAGNCSLGECRFAGSVGARWIARVAPPTTCFRGLCRPRVEDQSRGRRETPRETASAWIRRIVGAARLRCGRRSSGPAAAACSACGPSAWCRRCASPQRRVLAGRDGSAMRLLEIDLGDALVAARVAPAGSRHPEGLRRAGGHAGGHRARRPSAAGRQCASTGRAGVCGHRARRSDSSATR